MLNTFDDGEPGRSARRAERQARIAAHLTLMEEAASQRSSTILSSNDASDDDDDDEEEFDGGNFKRGGESSSSTLETESRTTRTRDDDDGRRPYRYVPTSASWRSSGSLRVKGLDPGKTKLIEFGAPSSEINLAAEQHLVDIVEMGGGGRGGSSWGSRSRDGRRGGNVFGRTTERLVSCHAKTLGLLSPRGKRIAAMTIWAVTIFCLGLAVGLSAKREIPSPPEPSASADSGADDEEGTTGSPWVPPDGRYEAILAEIASASSSLLGGGGGDDGFRSAVLSDPTTPQFRALDWIANVDESRTPVTSDRLLGRYALAVLYYATNHPEMEGGEGVGNATARGGSWVREDGWLTSDDVCRWHGVTCEAPASASAAEPANEGGGGTIWTHDEQRQRNYDLAPSEGGGEEAGMSAAIVTGLNLTSNGLRGSIPSEIALLASSYSSSAGLTSLDLSTNSLRGTLPPSLRGMKSLTKLYLGSNTLEGTLQTVLGELTLLTDLYLNENRFKGSLPSELGRLSRLEGMGLYGNELNGTIPSTFGLMTNLLALYLDENRLTGSIPTEFGNLRFLGDLRLRENELVGPIPEEIGGVSNLEILYADGNFLTGTIPSSLSKLTYMTEFHCYKNRLSGKLPKELGNLSQLSLLYLDNNELTGKIPPEFGRLRHLATLYLFRNRLAGPIPETIVGMQALRGLRLYDNKITGTIPKEMSRLRRLETLFLENNAMRGGVPSEFGNLTRLEKL